MASYTSTSSIGAATLDSSYYWSKDKYYLSTGYGSVGQTSLENFSGASANLDTVSASKWGYGYANATEGSAVSTTVYLGASESVSWNVKGQYSKDYVGDFAYASVAFLGNSPGGFASYSNTKKLFDDGYTYAQTAAWSNGTNVSFTAPTAGFYKFTTGVVDAGDTVVDSQIAVTNFGQSLIFNSNSANAVNLSPTGFVSAGPIANLSTAAQFFGNAQAQSNGYKLTTSDSVQTQTDSAVESWLGLAGGTLDQVEKENPYGYTTYANATSGSAMKKYVKINGVGDTIKFNYFFDGSEYIPYDDFAFVTVGGKVVSNETDKLATLYKNSGGTEITKTQYIGAEGSKSLVSVQGAGSYNDVKGVFEYKVTSSDTIVTDSSGNKYVELGIGIMDEGDTVVDSNLFVSDIGSSADNGYSGFGSSSFFTSSFFNSYSYSSQNYSSLQSSAQSLKANTFSSSFSQFEYNSTSYTSQTLKQNSSMIASSLANLDFGLISSSSSISTKFDWNSTFNTLFNTSSLSTSLNVSVSIDIKAVQTQVLNQIDWSGVNFGNVQSNTYKAIDFNKVNFSSVDFSSTNYKSFDYSSVNWSGLNSSKYSEINWSTVDFSSSSFSTEAFSSVNWSKFSNTDLTELAQNSKASSAFNALASKSIGFSSKSEYSAFATAAQKAGSQLSFKSFNEINFSSKSFTSAALNGVIDYSSVSQTSFKKFSSTAYSALDWSNSQFVGALNTTNYSTINYSKVEWSELTSSSSAAEAFNFSSVNFKQFKSTTYSSINWSNFDFSEASSSNSFKNFNFSKVDWSQVSESQYSEVAWTAKAIKQVSYSKSSSSFNYEAMLTSESFSSISASSSTYNAFNYKTADFSQISSTSYNAINWNSFNWKKAQANGTQSLTSIDYNKVQWSEIQSSSYKKVNWSKVQYSEITATSFQSIDWSNVNYGQFFKGSSTNYSASTFSSVDYTEFSEKSYKQFGKSAKSASAKKFSSFDFQSVSASTFTSTATKTDVFDCAKLNKVGQISSIDLLNDNTSSSVVGDAILLSKNQKSAVSIQNFTLGVDQLSFAGLGALASSVAFIDTAAGLSVVAGGATFATLAGLTKATVEASAAYKAGKGLGQVL